jgi:hypothetical protein
VPITLVGRTEVGPALIALVSPRIFGFDGHFEVKAFGVLDCPLKASTVLNGRMLNQENLFASQHLNEANLLNLRENFIRFQ